MKISTFLCLLSFCLAFSCSRVVPTGLFNAEKVSAAPDYSDPYYWAALPSKKDSADHIPAPLRPQKELGDAVDIFFLYPTIYTGKKGDTEWNAPVNDDAFNERVDASTILFQASAFNATGRVYAPRYRQAHLSAYYSKDPNTSKKVFELAYQDLKMAFEYYLENYNQERPIIIAAHSQGTTHGKRLVKAFFDGTELQKQLVAAYLIGIPVLKNEYENIPVCQSPDETGCFISWRTYRSGYTPKNFTSDKIAVVNPLSWTTSAQKADRQLNKGGTLRNIDKLFPALTDAQIIEESGILWAQRPKFFGNFLLRTKNYHVADYNFYYLNIRENAQLRAKAFLEKNDSSKEAGKQ